MGISPLFKEKGNARFVNMTDGYNPSLRDLFLKVAKQENILLHQGVYFWFCGPNFETPAEIRAAKILGGDVVGMSTVPEVLDRIVRTVEPQDNDNFLEIGPGDGSLTEYGSKSLLLLLKNHDQDEIL